MGSLEETVEIPIPGRTVSPPSSAAKAEVVEAAKPSVPESGAGARSAQADFAEEKNSFRPLSRMVWRAVTWC